MMNGIEDCFFELNGTDKTGVLPQRFTFPFFYEPHPLCQLASKELQLYLESQTDWAHDFGIDHFVEGVNIGKMFGVLLVEREDGCVGYLRAFSGKLAEQNHLPGFVPPVADILAVDSFFRKGEKEIALVSEEIDQILKSKEYLCTQDVLRNTQENAAKEIANQKRRNKEAKARRKERRNALMSISEEESALMMKSLENESKKDHFELKDLTRKWKQRIEESQNEFDAVFSKVENLKKQRKARSGTLQKEIFDQYQFLNTKGEMKSVEAIFQNTALKTPPSGAGDCALPKLLQFAFIHHLKPLAMAEFWWGQSPNSEIRKHGYFYPSCKGKCEPILAHMLDGMQVDPSPMSLVSTASKQLEMIFEDEYLVVINKPADFLSVPGKTNADSVHERMIKMYPEATGPMIVHRLDRATSGLMIIAKTKDVHQILQDQFRTRTVKKQYVAMLEGVLEKDKGSITLPLRVDLDDRPRQLVCYEHGKSALTHWKVLERTGERTRIQFFPVTGRTHQLRVHAAHPKGLNMPIVGDDLYGQKETRLHLHAASIAFDHPESKERITFQTPSDF